MINNLKGSEDNFVSWVLLNLISNFIWCHNCQQHILRFSEHKMLLQEFWLVHQIHNNCNIDGKSFQLFSLWSCLLCLSQLSSGLDGLKHLLGFCLQPCKNRKICRHRWTRYLSVLQFLVQDSFDLDCLYFWRILWYCFYQPINTKC